MISIYRTFFNEPGFPLRREVFYDENEKVKEMKVYNLDGSLKFSRPYSNDILTLQDIKFMDRSDPTVARGR